MKFVNNSLTRILKTRFAVFRKTVFLLNQLSLKKQACSFLLNRLINYISLMFQAMKDAKNIDNGEFLEKISAKTTVKFSKGDSYSTS
jgi:hypothetical protein